MEILQEYIKKYDIKIPDYLENSHKNISLALDKGDINLLKSAYIKFGGGWFNVFSKNLLKLIDVPDSLGHYGLDDTFVAEAANILKNNNYNVEQYIINDVIVKEDRVYRTYSMDKFFSKNSNQNSMRDNSSLNYGVEIQNFQNKIHK